MISYESYSTTVLSWLREMPSHWVTMRAKYMFQKESRVVSDSDDVVTCFRDGMVTLRKNRRTSGFTESIQESGYQAIRKGDLVIHVMDAFAGAVGVSDSDGKGTPVYSVCTAKGDYSNYYFAHVVREMAKSGFIQSLYRGIRQRSSDFRFEIFAAQYLPVPPRSEQDKIVRYLDWQVSKTNKLIHALKKQIVLLKEQKQAIINEAVTKGLDLTIPMKDSGIDWIGEVPTSWRISKIDNHFAIRKRIAGSEGYNVLSITQQGLKIKDISTNEGQMAANYSGYQFVYPGEFAMNHMDLLTGYIDISKFIGVTSPDYRVFGLEDTDNCFPEYYLHLFQLCYKRRIFYGFGRGAANQGRWRMPAVNFRNFIIPLPKIDEQAKIVAYLNEQCVKIDTLIENINNEIVILVEYRTRLISDVVTGQIDVRDVEVPEFEWISVEADIESDDEISDVEVAEEE